MLSLPLITPVHPIHLFPSPHTTPSPAGPDTAPSDPTLAAAAQAQRRQQQQQQKPSSNPLSALSQLKADEDAIRQRKWNISRFGSTWIKPAGIGKTLQAETEERAEREEQEALARREQMLLDLQAQQEREEARGRMAADEGGGATGATEVGETTRDLDDEVPDADEVDVSDDDDEDEDDDDESLLTQDYQIERDLDADALPEASGLGTSLMEERDLDMSVPEGMDTTEADMTFTDGSLLEGSMFVDMNRGGDEEDEEVARAIAEQERYARIEEAELTGAVQEGYDLGMEGDLDGSVPDAGAYEHTDTELEDDSSDDEEEEVEEDVSFAAPTGPPPQSRTSSRAGLFDISRRALGGRQSGGGSAGSRSSLSARDASSLLDSSFITSSPVVGRLRSGNNRGRSR